jgi:hypothetical protein
MNSRIKEKAPGITAVPQKTTASLLELNHHHQPMRRRLSRPSSTTVYPSLKRNG